jgi:hypothetical protein
VPEVSSGLTSVPTTGAARAGSVAMVRWYLTACGTTDQRSTSGSAGQLTDRSSEGSCRAGVEAQLLVNERTADHLPAVSRALTARTRQKYWPSATVRSSVAAVLRVRYEPRPGPDPCTTDVNLLDAESWKS